VGAASPLYHLRTTMNPSHCPDLAEHAARLAENNARIERLVEQLASRGGAKHLESPQPPQRPKPSRSLRRLIAAGVKARAARARGL
jgi:hypothetical protein